MKKFFIFIIGLVFFVILANYLIYYQGIFFLPSDESVTTTFTRTDGKTLLVDQGNGFEEFEIRGVDLGTGIPGTWSTDFAIDKETYLRWFALIKEMGANVLRVYTVQNEAFYEAFYEYNMNHAEPLYLLHGVWVSDYALNSHQSAYDFLDTFLEDCEIMVDVIHGQRKIGPGEHSYSAQGEYEKDVSPWVIGYILGVQWEDVTVAYTDDKYAQDPDKNSFSGNYMYTAKNARPFEAWLANAGDHVISYETKKYKTQRLLAFSNWAVTDPFAYPAEVVNFCEKCAQVDVEHILCTENFISGQFASYHVYPYYPDYLSYIEDWSCVGLDDKSSHLTEDMKANTYVSYLTAINQHHSMPVVISEFGVSTGRGMAQRDINTGRNQGAMSENEQGQALVECLEDIKAAGCNGGCIFAWQDEWFKHTWNTMYAVDLSRSAYWSDYQTNDQYFGLLAFDPGEEHSVCYVDGDVSEWKEEDLVSGQDGLELSMKTDERYLYLMIHQDRLNTAENPVYIPIDVTPKSGSSYCENFDLRFDRAADFLLVLNGEDNSRLLVQEYYEALRANFAREAYGYDTYQGEHKPSQTSPSFVKISLILKERSQKAGFFAESELYETGKLRYGDANPEHKEFDSLADFCQGGEYLELRIPWQLLNFSDPSRQTVHDQYYEGNYGVEYVKIDALNIGIGDGTKKDRIVMKSYELEGWDEDVTCHERLKQSYYILMEYWNQDREE